jgi:D-serine dehydratase
VKHYWPDITLPDLTLSEFSMSHSMIVGFARNLGLSIALRTALALAFPVAAQLLLQQRDID